MKNACCAALLFLALTAPALAGPNGGGSGGGEVHGLSGFSSPGGWQPQTTSPQPTFDNARPTPVIPLRPEQPNGRPVVRPRPLVYDGSYDFYKRICYVNPFLQPSATPDRCNTNPWAFYVLPKDAFFGAP